MARWQGNADLRPVLPVGAGIARERETRTVGAAPRQREYRPLSQSRMARPLGVPAGNIPVLCRDGRGVQEEPIMWVFARGGSNPYFSYSRPEAHPKEPQPVERGDGTA